MKAKGQTCQIRYKIIINSSVQEFENIEIFEFVNHSRNAVMIPSPTNNHLMDSAPIIGVIIKGKRETKMIGPFKDDNKLLTVKAITNPRIITNGSVIKQKVIVKRKALKNFTFSNSKKFRCQKCYICWLYPSKKISAVGPIFAEIS